MPLAHRLHPALAACACALFAYGCGPAEPSITERCAKRLPGDLVISEFMNDPAGTDTGNEWVELYNATGADIDLKGMSLVAGAADGSGQKEYVFTAATVKGGGYFVAGDARTSPAPAFMNQSYADKLGGLRNSDGLLQIRCGTKVLDEVKYAVAPGTNGHSNELDGKLVPDSAVNDQLTNFCASQVTFDAQNFGTPGAANAQCGTSGSSTCTDATTGTARAVVRPNSGELFITEFQADPAIVGDTEGEWIEVYAPSKSVDLNGLALESGSSTTNFASPTCLTVPAGAFAVLAKKDDPALNGGLPPVTATFTVSLPNTNGLVTLRNGDVIVDQISWVDTSAGASSQLSPDAMDATGNDDPLNFCTSQKPYGQGDLGSPGVANAACPPIVTTGNCFDPDIGNVRAIVKPAVGDVVITELMQNPSGVDTDGEWMEVTALKDVDLNGLRFEAGTSGTDISSNECVHLPAGSFAILAKNIDSTVNGGLPFVTWKVNYSLANTSGTASIKDGANALDTVSWSSSTDSASWQLDNLKYDPAANDDPANWCTALVSYGTNPNKGTPGADNHGCGSASAPKCFDTGTNMVRDAVLPQVGDLVITEFHANPAAVGDSAGEFFEVLAKADVDLNGLQIANEGTGNTTIKATDCLGVKNGDYLVFARGTDPALNGGLQNVTAKFNFSLGNYGTVALPKALILRREAFEIDKVTWIASTSGASSQLAPDKLDNVSNDDAANFCATPAGNTYGAGDLGTPGAANVACQ